jgi:hypothetical protein
MLHLRDLAALKPFDERSPGDADGAPATVRHAQIVSFQVAGLDQVYEMIAAAAKRTRYNVNRQTVAGWQFDHERNV